MLSSRYKLTPTSSSPTPTPTHTATTPPDEAALPPPPSLDTPANHQYPDPTLSHTSSRTLAMRCLRETSSMTLSATTIFDMNNALDQALPDTSTSSTTPLVSQSLHDAATPRHPQHPTPVIHQYLPTNPYPLASPNLLRPSMTVPLNLTPSMLLQHPRLHPFPLAPSPPLLRYRQSQILLKSTVREIGHPTIHTLHTRNMMNALGTHH